MQLSTLIRIPQTMRNLQRLREIVRVLVKYGWGDLVPRLGFAGWVERLRRRLRGEAEDPAAEALTTEQRIRMAFEELGPTFIKLGQVLATRPDLIPMSLVEELRLLQDRVPPFPAEQARREIERELGRPIGELFATFDDVPLAAASIAQVHRATLRDGTQVVVKVRRPGLEAIIANDLDILIALAGLLEDNLPEARQFSPRAIAEEFRRSIGHEIDLTREARNIERFARNFRGDRSICVLKTYPELSSRAVLTLEFIDGIKASDVAALEAAGIDRSALARRGVELVVRQVFQHGFFHADPHPGNVFILRDGRIAPIDMGMMGVLDRDMRDALLELMTGVLLGDAGKIVGLFQRLALVDERADLPALRRDAQEMIDAYRELPLEEVDIGAFVGELFDVLARHQVLVPPELLLTGKALATVEGLARILDPRLDPMQAMRPLVLRFYLERLADPRFLARDAIRAGEETVTLLARLPRELTAILASLRSGHFRVVAHVEGQDRAVLERARGTNRLALSLMISALIVGSAMLLAAGGGPSILGIPGSALLGALGLLTAGGGYLIVAWGFLRSGRF
ncbi:MAG: AarF/ABC1/UbiB kinase family protein [Thermodesulfobacteriota bacterium]